MMRNLTGMLAVVTMLLVACGEQTPRPVSPGSASSSTASTSSPADAAAPVPVSFVTQLSVTEASEAAFLAWSKTYLAEQARVPNALVVLTTATKQPRTYVLIERFADGSAVDATRMQRTAKKLEEWATEAPRVMRLTDAVQALDRHAPGDANTIALVVTMGIKPESEQAFIDLSNGFLVKATKDEPGALMTAVAKHPTEPNTYVWLERYRDDAAVKDHLQTPHFKETSPQLRDMIATKPDMLWLKQVSP